MDSTCVLIGLQVCFHSAMKQENDVSNIVGCLQAVRIYSFMKEIKVYIRASYIIFLFVKTEYNFIKEIKHVLDAFIDWWKPRQSFCMRILEQVKTLDCVSDFHWSALEFSQSFASGFIRLWRQGKYVFLNNTYNHEALANCR